MKNDVSQIFKWWKVILSPNGPVFECQLNIELNLILIIQARIAQLVAYRLGTEDVPGSNPGKGENFSMKISY